MSTDFLELARIAVTSASYFNGLYDDADDSEEFNLTDETSEAIQQFRRNLAQVQAILSIAVDLNRFADVIQGYTAAKTSKHRENADTYIKQAIGMYEAANSAQTGMEASEKEENINYMVKHGEEWADDAQRLALLAIAYNMRRAADSIAKFQI